MDHSGELRAVIAALDRYTRDLNKQLEDEKHDAKVATDRMQRLLETKDASMGRQFIDDNKPKDLFTMLLSNVKKVVKLGVTEHDDLNLSFDTESSRHILHRVAPILSQGITLEQLFQSKEPSERLKFMRYFLRSYVTYVLCDEILPPLRPNDLSEPRQADHWAETEVSKSIGQIEDELVKAGQLQRHSGSIKLQADKTVLTESSHQQITQRDICTWRAMTVDILTRATATPTQNAQRAAENAARKMLLYFPKKEDPVLRRKLFELCQEAISLSQRLRQQRAQWHVCHPSDIKLANFKSWVEDVTGGVPGPAAIVEFNLSPALVKSGNIDGERYDTESCIEPAEVSYGTILETQDQKPRPAPPISSKSFNSSENDVFGRNRSLIKPGFPRNDSTLDNPAKAILESNEVGARNRKEIASGEHVQISGTETHGCSECSDSMPESSATSFRGSIAADDGPRIQRKPNMASIYGTSLEQNASNDMGSAKPEDFDLK